MPLLVPKVIPKPKPSPGQQSATGQQWRTHIVTWTSWDGEVTYLTDHGHLILEGVRGLDMPKFNHFMDEPPGMDGAISRGVRATVREIFLPLDISGRTRQEFLDKKRALLRRMDPKRGTGRLTWAEPDGTRRHIDCFYDSGMEGEYGRGDHTRVSQKFGLVLKAFDPYWYGDAEYHVWKTPEGSGGGGSFFPLVHDPDNFVELEPSQVLGSTSVVNDGDVEAWPVWTITGPATSIELENVTTGKKIELSSSLSSGQKRIITTKPGVSTVVDENGDNKWSELSDTSALWALEPGLNELVLTVGNSDADTVVEMTYHPRYEGV